VVDSGRDSRGIFEELRIYISRVERKSPEKEKQNVNNKLQKLGTSPNIVESKR
jgi:uncharacterized protein (UPF0335 family)